MKQLMKTFNRRLVVTHLLSLILLTMTVRPTLAGNLSTLLNAGNSTSSELAANHYFRNGGKPVFCLKKTITSAGVVHESSINDGYTCDTGKLCSSGQCIAGSGLPICSSTSTVGDICPGGAKYAGSYGGSDFMVTPGGCTNSNPATCSGGTDTITLAWGSTVLTGVNSITDDGASNTETLATSYSDTYAAKFCYNLEYGGYSDWFLPGFPILTLLYNGRAAIGGFASSMYWTSAEMNSSSGRSKEFATGNNYTTGGKANPYYIRCVRKL